MKKSFKKILSVVLIVTMLIPSIAMFSTSAAEGDVDPTKIAVPETVYMVPVMSQDTSVARSTHGQYYVNNILEAQGAHNVYTVAEANDGMYIGVYSPGAKSYTINITNVTNPANDIYIGDVNGTVNSENKAVTIDSTGMSYSDNSQGLHFASGGLAPGESATAKWEITFQYDGYKKTYIAYTVMYAPHRTVGAVSESRRASDQNNEISTWISGINGVDHNAQSPLGHIKAALQNSGYFKKDPLAYPNASDIPAGSSKTADDYIVVNAGNYVMQTAPNGADGSRARSYIGKLTVDSSRYTNTNQIPNLKFGFDVVRADTRNANNSLEEYWTYYTLGDANAFATTDMHANPSGWTQHAYYDRPLKENYAFDVPYRSTVAPSYAVSAINGKYLHAYGHATCQGLSTYAHTGSGTSVLCSVTNKAALRNSTVNGYTLSRDYYTETSFARFEAALQNAGTVLGNPAADQNTINAAQTNLDTARAGLEYAYAALRYDNLFSAYEFSQKPGSMVTNDANASVTYNAGSITVVSNGTATSDIYTIYGTAANQYNLVLKPSTDYVFEYDLNTQDGSQLFLFFHDASGAWIPATNRSVQLGTNAPTAVTDGNPFLSTYQTYNGHITLRFTTPANMDKMSLRFGNVSTTTNQSTFSNIRLVEADKYLADAQYSATESTHFKFDPYGTLVTPTRDNHIFMGWVDANGNPVTADQLATEHKTVYSTWMLDNIPVYFDTILDFSKWNTEVASHGAFSNVTDNGFTLTSDAGVSETTSESPAIPVTPGKQYYVDLEATGGDWDVYVFFQNETVGGVGINFSDSTNRFSANGSGNAARTFTAPEGATKMVVRVDANGASNSVTFSDIRVYEAGTREAGVNVPSSNKTVKYNSTFGTLPVPTKEGYTFLGWYDENDNLVTEATAVTYTSAIYLHSKWEETASANDDTYVIDYGLGVKINVCANDDLGDGTVTLVGTTLADGTTLNSVGYATSQLTDGVRTNLALPNGKVTKSGVNIFTYTPTNALMSSENTFYYEFQNDADGLFYYAKVTVIPATSMYFEESFMTFKNGGTGYTWKNSGTAISGKFQAEDRPGDFFPEYDANNVYGNDAAYSNSVTHSLGQAKYTTVDEASVGKEAYATFTFSGTGFDLFSVTSNNTGAVLVTIKKSGETAIYKNYLVDTYYGYTVDNEGALAPDGESTGALYQVPVISARELGYGTYDVTIKPIYSSAFDPNYVKGGNQKDNAYDFYVDSVRIFNPAGLTPDGVIGDAYLADGEYAPTYVEIRNTIIDAGEYQDVVDGLQTSYDGSIFIDSKGVANVETYKNEGPKNELYLGQNQAIAFNVSAEDLAGIQIGMKVASGDATASVVIMNANDTTPDTITVNGANEQYYKMASDLVLDNANNPIIIVNTSDTVVSLTSLKITHSAPPVEVNEMSLINVSFSTGEMATYAVNRVIADVADPDEPTTEEPSTDEPTTEEPSTDAPVEDGSQNIFDTILGFFKKILDFFRGIFG